MNEQMVPPPPPPISNFAVVLKSGERQSVKASKCVSSESTYDFVDDEGQVVRQFAKKDVASISTA